MPRANGASATVWVLRRQPKFTYLISVLTLVVLLVGVGAFVLTRNRDAGCNLVLPQGCVSLEKVATPEARARGLSGRPQLASDQAMLFVYDAPGAPCFWMKDMQFPLDMVWLDASKRIVTITADVAPSTYPAESFCSDQPAQYVLEMPAGTAARNQLETGQQLQF